MIDKDDISRTSALCSVLGHRILHGDTAIVKSLYGNIWMEYPAIIQTTNQLQECLTSIEVEDNAENIYNAEFLYYWGMICLGDQSPLIGKELETAETCFQKINDTVPQAEARLAYINLLRSVEPFKSERHVYWLEELRQCASKQRDLFSMIVLAKICFQSFLAEHQENNPDMPITGLPLKVMNLLNRPCQQGHPVAIRFWNKMLTCIGTPEAMSQRIAESCIRPYTLYDFKTSANVQISL